MMLRVSIQRAILFYLVALSMVGWTRTGSASATDTRMLASPAITEGKIAFVYADDLWVADRDGSHPRRLTSHPGEERNPFFSKDGKQVTFTASYDGNVDVYVIPSEGGEPRRLTWHPGDDTVRGFTPDGKVLFSSTRSVFSRRHSQLFTMDTGGGVATPLPVPSAQKGAISPDGKLLAYTPLGEAFGQWKNYRGGMASRIWVLKLADLSYEEIPKPSGGCNDTDPAWIGDVVYFLSDRDGEFNLYSFDIKSRKVSRRTEHDSFPIASATAGAGRLIYEQAGRIHVYEPESHKSYALTIGIAADGVETRPRYVSGAKYVRAAEISPTGKRAVLEYRGEIVTVPAKKGDPRNLTRTPDVHERSPVWSPDGKSIAYFSDGGGEYALVVRPQDGQGEGKTYAVKGKGFYERPEWSPDSKKIAFIDNSRTLYWIDLASGATRTIGSDSIYGPFNTLTCSWSPDSKWLAYTLTNTAGFQTVWLYGLDSQKSVAVTDGLAEAGEPVFDAGGKYLYFLASTDAGPVKNWFEQSFTDVHSTHSIYLMTLSKSVANPLVKENDEEGASDAAKSADSSDKTKAADAKAKEPKEKAADKSIAPVAIDLDGMGSRIVALPIVAGNIEGLEAGDEGQLYYVRRVDVGDATAASGRGKPVLERFELKKRETETLASGVNGFRISADHKKILYVSGDPGGGRPGAGAGGTFAMGIVDAGKFSKGDGSVSLDAISVRVEPRAEWKQMLREAWRINRDYFYATNMHGADWDGVWKKYESLVPEAATRGDLSRIIRMMLSELAVGHSYSMGGERLYEPKPVPVGLLGADYQVADGRYRIHRIYGGAYWDPSLLAPLASPGVDIKVGEFLIAVDGRPITTESEVFRPFEGTVGRRVELKVGPTADGKGARTVMVEPIGDESALRNRAWVEGNLRKVHERTKGRVAYVYVPNTAQPGYDYFKRYFFPQGAKEAIIVDERFNGGGQVADYYINLLRRPLVSYWATRYGETLRTPGAAILGPKVMIVDETAGSGGDLLPWMFHKFGLGKLVGKKTWGGLVGILGFPVLMDGASVTAPNLAIFTEDGWVVENVGVPPDIDVEQDPAAVAAGKDPQLDKAIEVVLKELEENPPAKALTRPPFPVRVRRTDGRAATTIGLKP